MADNDLGIKYNPGQADDPFTAGNDYTNDLRGKNPLYDPRVIADLRSHYDELGHNVQGMTDEEIVDEFYSDKTWGMLNTGGGAKRLYESTQLSDEGKHRLQRLNKVYEMAPKFWQEGGRGWLDALGSGTAAVVLDPINLIPFGKAFQAGAYAMKAGKTGWQATKAGAGRGAMYEGAIGGAHEGIMATMEENERKNLGYQREVDTGNILSRAALGTAFGVGTGAVLGGVAGRSGYDSRIGEVFGTTGAQQVEAGRFVGMTDDEIARMTHKEGEELVKKFKAGDLVEGSARSADTAVTGDSPEVTTEGPTQPELSPDEVKMVDEQSQIDAAIAEYELNETQLRRDNSDGTLDPQIQEAREQIAALQNLRNFGQRVRSKKEEIDDLATNVPKESAEFQRRVADYNEAYSNYRYAISSIGKPEFNDVMKDIVRGLELDTTPPPKVETGTAPEAPVNPEATGEAVGVEVAPEGTPPKAGDAPELGDPAPVGTSPEVGDAPEPPEVMTDIPYLNTKQVAKIDNEILKPYGITEPELKVILDDPANGVVTRSKGKFPGRITNQTIKEIKEHLDGKKTDTAPEVDTTPPSPPETSAVSAELRGYALAGGIDPNKLTPAGKRKAVSKVQIDRAINDATAEDEYAKKAYEELGRISEMFGEGEVDVNVAEAAIRAIANDESFTVPAEDLISLRRYLDNLPDEFVDESVSSQPLTQTQKKKIRSRKSVLKKQFPGLTDEAAETMARSQILSQTSETAVRGTGDAIEDASKFKTAGLSNNGRIQGILRRGTRIGKGSAYTVTGKSPRRNEFGFEAALIRAKSGDGPDVVEYQTMGKEKILTRNGPVEVPKGTTAYADAVSGRAFDTLEFALEFRDGGKPSATRLADYNEIAPGDQPTKSPIDLAGILEKHKDNPAELIKILEAAVRKTEPPSETPATKTTKTIPPQRGDHIAVVRSMDDPEDVRMLNPKTQEGQDISVVIGKTGPKSDPARWEVRYAPRESYTNRPKDRKRLFESLEPETNDGVTASTRGFRYEAGFASGMGDPISYKDMGTLKLTDDVITPDLQNAVTYGLGSRAPTFNTDNVVSDLYAVIRTIERQRWQRRVDANKKTAMHLETLYSAMDRVAPQGFINDSTTRAQSIEELKAVFSKKSQEAIDDAVNFLESIGGDRGIGPSFQKARSGNFQQTTASRSEGVKQFINLDGNSSPSQTPTNTLYHEVAHWAYDNILTPSDKIEFWKSMNKYYDEGGNLDRDAITNKLTDYSGMRDETGNQFVGGNSMDSPQELFANQFDLWATRKRHIAGSDTFWSKINHLIKAIFQRYAKDAEIDPDLEKLFSKILPDSERPKFKLGFDVKPTTDYTKHIHKRWADLTLIRSELDDALMRDSASGIVSATQELVGFMLSVAPRYSKKKLAELSAAGLPISRTFGPFDGRRGMRRTIHDRIDDLTEILSGKSVDWDGVSGKTDDTAGYYDDGLSLGADEQAVADVLRDFYENGYNGQYKPSRGISPGAEKKMNNTSLSKTLDNMLNALEAHYNAKEIGNLPGSKPATEPKTKPRGKANSAIRKRKKLNNRSAKAVDGDAKSRAKTPPSKRKKSTTATAVTDGNAPEIKSKSVSDLRTLYVAHRGTDFGDQIALELLRKEKAVPLANPVKVTREVMSLGKADLEQRYLDALDGNSSKDIDMVVSELRRRHANKGLKKGDPAKIPATFIDKSGLLQREVLDNQGISTHDGVPSYARASVRELLGTITHRDPEVEYTARTMTYRMLNMMGKTQQQAIGRMNIFSSEDLARLAGEQPGATDTPLFADLRGPHFKKLRSDMRRLSVGLTRGETSPYDIIHEIGHMLVRANVMPDEEMTAVRELYNKSDDAVKKRVQSKYGAKYVNRDDKILDELLAEEWFAESLTEYMAERVARGDIVNSVVTGDVSKLRLRNTFERALDRMVEYTAYTLNGLIGRNDIKQQFRRLALYGDMFEVDDKYPLKNMVRSGPAIHPSLAADSVRDYVMASPRAKHEQMMDFVRDGISHNKDDNDIIPYYHGTPNGFAFNRSLNPNVVLRPSTRGFYGPGTYLTDSPVAASGTYARKPTPESMRQQIMDTDLSDEVKEELIYDAMDLHEIRKQISTARRNYWLAESTGDKDMIQKYREDLDEMVEAEEAIQDALGEANIKADPMVIPTLVNVRNPADFREKTAFTDAQDNLVRAVVDYFNMTDTLNENAVKKFAGAWSDGPLNGRQMYLNFVELLTGSGRGKLRAQSELNEALEDLGYDGMLTTHYNTQDASGDIPKMANGETYEGVQIPHTGVVVFDVGNVKHIDANEFDSSDPRLFRREEMAIPRGLIGEGLNMIAEGDINGVGDIPSGMLGDVLEYNQVDRSITSAIMSIGKKRPLDVREEQAIKKATPFGMWSAQSTNMREMGARWTGDWFENHFPDVHQRFAKTYMPLKRLMEELPDAKGYVGSWFERGPRTLLSPLLPSQLKASQPKSHAKIVGALRFGTGSRQYADLTKQEKKVYQAVRGAFDQEWSNMNELGIFVGKRENYLPQIWDKEKILSNEPKFIADMMEYYQLEGTSNGIVRTSDEAKKFADEMFHRLTSDEADGHFMPQKAGSRNSVSDHIDHSRVLELEKYPLSMAKLQDFLEDDLDAMLVKYFDGTSRRIAQTEKFGVNAHGFYDYMYIAEKGVQGIADLLGKNKTFRKNFSALGENGHMEDVVLEELVAMPFATKPMMATRFASALVAEQAKNGTAGVEKMLDDIAVTGFGGKVPPAYTRRKEAIVAALSDFKGERAAWNNGHFNFMEQALRVAQKKPQHGRELFSRTSKVLRGINSVTLLGWTTLTSLPDTALPIIRSGSIKDWAKGIYKYKNDPEYARMIQNVGVAIENIVHERQLHMYGAIDGKMTNAFFNATMLTPWTDLNRKIAAATAYESFKAMQSKAAKSYRPELGGVQNQTPEYKTAHRYLMRVGLGDFLPTGSRRGENLGNPRLMEDDAALRTSVIRFANQSVFQPNADDMPLLWQTPMGAIFTQLKSFPLMMHRLFMHTVNEAFGVTKADGTAGKLTLNFNKANKNFLPLAYLLTLGPLAGAGALGVKDVIQMRGGEEEKEMAFRKRSAAKFLGFKEEQHGDIDKFLGWYLEGMMAMGGLGLLADLFHTTSTQIDNASYGSQRIWSTLLGPTYGLGNTGFNITAGAVDASLGLTDSNAKERTAARDFITRVPVLGGNRAFKEGAVDAIAGEATGRKGKGKIPDWYQGAKTWN